MRAGPLDRPAMLELPHGCDADLNLYFVSDMTGMDAKVVISGVNEFACARDIQQLALEVTTAPEFARVASDWRMMGNAEVLNYRARQKKVTSSEPQDPA